jgi:mannitol/fructose-specific phosphotransferase system IIA component (Ntr-type)
VLAASPLLILALRDEPVARMTLAQFTEPKLLVPRLLSERQEDVIVELAKRLESAERIANAGRFAQSLMACESLAVAVLDGVAFPHARGGAVKKLSFALGLSQPCIRWGRGRSPVVHTVALFAVPLSEGQTYLSLVMAFSSFMKDEPAFSALRRYVRPEAMLNVLEQVRVVRMGTTPRMAMATAGHGNKI